MDKHLREIAKAVAPSAHAVLVLDGTGWHGSPQLQRRDFVIRVLPSAVPKPGRDPAGRLATYDLGLKIAALDGGCDLREPGIGAAPEMR